ncbi:methyltransferase domain-containing protein [Micromonospora rifamycinica]|uniref:class I SAM-dependent methyltransferase n=1 Tax=Micromonospora rifamycinica TaxID=291594 RepID=UPI002E2AB337|nr:class I SAM-dependent methyltransferase [Micromonospora rifamycinica]
MTHSFDRAYWQQHWQQTHDNRPGSMAGNPPNPYLARETAGLPPSTALDAGCGAGAEAIWLAAHGWRVTAADISADALARAADRAADGPAEAVRWVEADLTVWEPGTRFDLVTSHYAHPAMPQLAFYRRLGEWVAPGGTLLIVGHLHTARSGHDHDHHDHDHDRGHHDQGHGHHGHPAEATVTLTDITAGLDTVGWEIVTAEEHQRPVPRPGGRSATLHDVVVRATRRP